MRGTTNLWRSGRLGRCARGDAALAPVAESGERMSQPTVGIVGNRNLARPLSGEAPSFRRGRTVTVALARRGGWGPSSDPGSLSCSRGPGSEDGPQPPRRAEPRPATGLGLARDG